MTMRDDIGARERLIRAYLEAYAGRDVQAMLACLHPQVRFRNVSGGTVTVSTDGVAAFRELAERSARMFASRAQAIRSVTHRGDQAIVAIAFEGVLAEGVPGGPAAGTRLVLDGETVFTFRDGRLAGIEDRS
jgi:ketosteroid isomerase-like protein